MCVTVGQTVTAQCLLLYLDILGYQLKEGSTAASALGDKGKEL
jgi:hypothetical protein